MDILSIFNSVFEPRTVMAMGSLVALITSAMLLLQAASGGSYRKILYTLAGAISLNAVSLGLFITYVDNPLAPETLFAVVAATASFVTGAFCLVLVYRSSFPLSVCWLYGLVCMLGYVFWQDIPGARNWNNVCQFVVAILAISVIARTPDPLAPSLRRVALGLCALSIVAMLPRMLTLIQPDLDPRVSVAPVVTVGYRLRLIIWALYPILLYACITSTIHARLAAKLRNAADLDMLTGAHSRRYLFEAGAKILDRRNVHQAKAAAVLLIDVDHFKDVNDRWGHLVGDAVLKHCVERIRQAVRRDDAVIGRYGGEEFCILLSRVVHDDASRLAERVRLELVENPYRKDDLVVPITVSIGVAQEVGNASLETLIRLADERLYRAKHSGRNRVIIEGGLLVPV
jgi:diguanylate cyclase (GGDEF)-like protein